MADYIEIYLPGGSSYKIATKESGTVHHQRSMTQVVDELGNPVDVSSESPMPITTAVSASAANGGTDVEDATTEVAPARPTTGTGRRIAITVTNPGVQPIYLALGDDAVVGDGLPLLE